MRIEQVKGKRLTRIFHSLPRRLYQSDPNFISHLDKDIEQVFDPKKNSAFQGGGKAMRWLLFDQKAKPIGRIAAFYRAEAQEGGIGFFECIDQRKAAHMLFKTAENWLLLSGMKSVQAPVNFGERDKYWGLLIDGFKNPAYQEPYNFPYYRKLFMEEGYQLEFKQTTSEICVDEFRIENFEGLRMRWQKNSDLEIRKFSYAHFDQFVADFVHIYNNAWGEKDFFVPLNEKRVADLFKSMKSIVREDLLLFTYYKKKPAAFYISIPDVNPVFKHLNGRFGLWHQLKFIFYLKRTAIKRSRGLVFGVVPKYQRLGITTGMIIQMYETMQNDPHLKCTELSWIGDFNPAMHALFEKVGAREVKIHHTYRKEFSKN